MFIALVLVGPSKQLKQIIQIEHNIVKDPSWPEANRGRGFELGATEKQMQVVVRAGLKPGTPDCDTLTTRPRRLASCDRTLVRTVSFLFQSQFPLREALYVIMVFIQSRMISTTPMIPCGRISEAIGHFAVPFGLYVRTSLRVKCVTTTGLLSCKSNYFHMKRFGRRLVLKPRHRLNRK